MTTENRKQDQDFVDTVPNPDVEPMRGVANCPPPSHGAFTDEELQDDGMGVFRGIVNSILLVGFCLLCAWVITEIVQAMRSGQ